MTEVNGYSLFDDILDIDLRTHNRAATLTNILKGGGMTMESVGNAMAYLKAIPQLERKLAVTALAENLGVKA